MSESETTDVKLNVFDLSVLISALEQNFLKFPENKKLLGDKHMLDPLVKKLSDATGRLVNGGTPSYQGHYGCNLCSKEYTDNEQRFNAILDELYYMEKHLKAYALLDRIDEKLWIASEFAIKYVREHLETLQVRQYLENKK